MAASSPTHPVGESLRTSQVQLLLDEALRRWQSIGVDVSALHGIDIRIADLGGRTLAQASGRTIWLDDNGAGWGWFVDATLSDDGEFYLPGHQVEQGRMDLLTALVHETGHLLGYDHEEDGAMAKTLTAGTRRTPHSGGTVFWVLLG
jgi:hypothetical protein